MTPGFHLLFFTVSSVLKDKEMKNSKLKWILAIVGTVILGAIGSGLWTLLFDPISRWVGRALFAIATLGLNALRTDVYASVAKGLHEQASLLMVAYFLLLVFGFFGFYMGTLLGRKIATRDTAKVISQMERDNPDTDDREKRIIVALEARYIAALRKLNKSLMFLFIVVAVFCSFQLFTLNYANSAVTHFKQCLAICEPYVSEVESKHFRSRFAQIESREHYESLLRDICKVVVANGAKCPEFMAF